MSFEQAKPMGMLQLFCGRGNQKTFSGRISAVDVLFQTLLLEVFSGSFPGVWTVEKCIPNQRRRSISTDRNRATNGDKDSPAIDASRTSSLPSHTVWKAFLVLRRPLTEVGVLVSRTGSAGVQNRERWRVHIHSHRHRDGLGCARPLLNTLIQPGGVCESARSAQVGTWIMKVVATEQGPRPAGYRLHLRPEPDCDQSQIDRGLKWLLKRLLRQYRLRCFKVEEVADDE